MIKIVSVNDVEICFFFFKNPDSISVAKAFANQKCDRWLRSSASLHRRDIQWHCTIGQQNRYPDIYKRDILNASNFKSIVDLMDPYSR